MKTALQLGKARKAVQAAQAQTLADEKAARIARDTSRAAKIKLKYARKIAKLARKATRNAAQKVAESLQALKRARKRLKKFEKRLERKKEKGKAPKNKRSKTRPKARVKKSSASTRSGSTVRRKSPAKNRPAKSITRRLARTKTLTALEEGRQPTSPETMEPEFKLESRVDDSSASAETGAPDESSGVSAA